MHTHKLFFAVFTVVTTLFLVSIPNPLPADRARGPSEQPFIDTMCMKFFKGNI